MTFEITIPVLNEQKTLVKNIGILKDFLSVHIANNIQWKIIIADNGSTDLTPKLASELAEDDQHIKVIQLPIKGVGAALQASWSKSKADLIGYMDLDLATDLKHISEVLEAIQRDHYDLVYGTRLHKNSKVHGRSFKRTLSSKVFNSILKAHLGVQFSDGMCGFKFLKRSALAPLMKSGAKSKGWFFSTELLIVAEHLNLKIKELPVIWTDDNTSSHVRVLTLAWKYLKAMNAIKKRLKK